jgi:hypothetical protein
MDMNNAQVVGRNVAFKVEGDKLLIEIDLKAQGVVSKSGLSQVIATTSGNRAISHAGKVLKLGVNVFTG